jgi:hypothetical protein
MRFVSCKLNYKHQIHEGRVLTHVVGNGKTVEEWLEPHLVAEFADRFDGLPLAERQKAREHFDRLHGVQEGAFSPAYRFDGIINCGDPDLDGTYYIGSTDAFRLSVFDTEKMCPRVDGMSPEQVREVFERKLSTSTDLGHTFIRTDDAVLVAPWPNYRRMSADQLVAACMMTGVSIASVLDYERGTENREEIVEALEEAIADDQAANTIDAALGGEPAPTPAAAAPKPAAAPKQRARRAAAPKEPVA